jgi:putative membrane protein
MAPEGGLPVDTAADALGEVAGAEPAQLAAVPGLPGEVTGGAPVVDPVRPDVDPAQRILDAQNEAIPEVPPDAGKAPVGSIPAAEARRAWARVQALNWRLFLIRSLAAGLAVALTVLLLPGLGFTGWHWSQFLRIAVVFGLLNALVKPALQFLALRFIFSTYGVVVVLINAVLLMLLGWLLPNTFEVYRPTALFFGGLVVGVLGMILETLLGANPPVLDREYKERNGLP